MAERNSWNYRNPCLTMHQPWASLLVHGIKRIEGRSWPAPIRGRLWIHAASKVPDEATIKAMEEFYREIYAVDGISDLKFPENYPVSRLLGCVQVVGCSRREELACWKEVSEGVRLEALTDFCWLCEQPQKLLVPYEMRGKQGVYSLERKVYEAAVRGLEPAGSPLPVKFPLPCDPFSLNPGSVFAQFPGSKAIEMEKSATLSSAIAGAQAAATQFSKKDLSSSNDAAQNRNRMDAKKIGKFESKSWERNRSPSGNFNKGSNRGTQFYAKKGQSSYSERNGMDTDNIGQFEINSWENNRSPSGNFNKESSRRTQFFAKRGQSSYSERNRMDAKNIGQFEINSWENHRSPSGNFNKGSNRTQFIVKQGQRSYSECDRISSHHQLPRADSNQHLRPPSKIFTDVMRELKLS